MIDNYKNILIIDDNEDDYFIINRCIKKDYKTVYNNGDKNIIDLTKTHNPDCILIDYHLGTKKGIDLLKELLLYQVIQSI